MHISMLQVLMIDTYYTSACVHAEHTHTHTHIHTYTHTHTHTHTHRAGTNGNNHSSHTCPCFSRWSKNWNDIQGHYDVCHLPKGIL